ncbi:IclR family transcriptional regulator [Tabrizicola fusiformis]|uniref:IclR family transcriptional regulator n=1 Tax=Tabrizicola sp. SY72 TaxID=2741673 RepID=UPI0019D5F66A|nr:IclR family transcriptional regulator [Tabrizicola sp. SY72]
MRKRTKPEEGADPVESGNPAASLTRGLEILRAFTANDSTLGNQDLIERTGLPKATVSRLTATLVALGYLHYDDRLGRYSIGPATVSLGYSALSSSAVVHIGRPLMQELADKTGVAVALGTRDGLEMVYLASCRSMSPVTLRLNVGSRLPIWRTAMGLAYLAEMRPEIRDLVLEEVVRAEPAQETQIRDLVAEAIQSYQTLGFVTTLGNWYSYINAVGVAFRPTDGSPLVALTCGGIVDIVPKQTCLEQVGPDLVRTVSRLRAVLTGQADAAAAAVRPKDWKTTAE